MPNGHTATAASHNRAPRPPADTDRAARARSERKIKLAASRARTTRARTAAAAAATVVAARGGGGGSGGGGSVGASSGGAENNDALKQMRKMRNRESAAVSRQRETRRVADLEIRMMVLEEENRHLRQVVRCRESAELGERHGGVDDYGGGVVGDDDDDDDGGGDDSLPSETPGNPCLWTPAAAAAACSATGSINTAPTTATAFTAAATPRGGFYGHAVPNAGAASAACGAASGAVHGAFASSNMISPSAVFAQTPLIRPGETSQTAHPLQSTTAASPRPPLPSPTPLHHVPPPHPLSCAATPRWGCEVWGEEGRERGGTWVGCGDGTHIEVCLMRERTLGAGRNLGIPAAEAIAPAQQQHQEKQHQLQYQRISRQHQEQQEQHQRQHQQRQQQQQQQDRLQQQHRQQQQQQQHRQQQQQQQYQQPQQQYQQQHQHQPQQWPQQQRYLVQPTTSAAAAAATANFHYVTSCEAYPGGHAQDQQHQASDNPSESALPTYPNQGYRTAGAGATGTGVGGWWAPQSGGGDGANYEEDIDYLFAGLMAEDGDNTFAEMAAKDRAGHL